MIPRALGLCAVIAMLGGCASGTAASGTVPHGVTAQRLMPAGRAAQGRSWMLSEAKSEDLLYVDAEDGIDTFVYSYPQGKLVGKIKQPGADMQQGLCSDRKGDVFVNAMDGNYGNTYEYAHGGTKPIEDLVEYYVWVYGCSVDPVTGNLAVASVNWLSAASYVAIYQNAKGTPQTYNDPAIVNYVFCGYDNKGNLFVDGTGRSGDFEFAELPKGSSTFTNIGVNQTIEWGGEVQWDGKHVAIGADDVSPAVAYQFAIKGSLGKEVGRTTLGSSGAVAQFWIQGNVIIGPEASADEVGLWKYPAGGAPIKTIAGVHDPFGATVSVAKK